MAYCNDGTSQHLLNSRVGIAYVLDPVRKAVLIEQDVFQLCTEIIVRYLCSVDQALQSEKLLDIFKGNHMLQNGNGNQVGNVVSIVLLLYRICNQPFLHLIADHRTGNFHAAQRSQEGYGELAIKIRRQTSEPAWGSWLTMGSTTALEGWRSSVRSYCHFFLGTNAV